MNQLLNLNQELTMSSLDIAELLEARHDSVKRSIERLADSEIISEPPLVDGPKATNGTTVKVYQVGKRDSYVIVAQLSPRFTARLVDRWQELEQKVQALPDFNNPVEAARAWADAKESEQKALADLQNAKPAVEFVNKYVECSGNKGFREVAKLLKIKENKFRSFLSDQKIMYRLGGTWMAYGCHIDAGRFEVSTGQNGDHAFNQCKFTPKGVQWVAGELAKFEVTKSMD